MCALNFVMLNKKPRPFLIVSQSDRLIQIVDINSHTKWQIVQKPTDLDLHYFQRQGISRISRTRFKSLGTSLHSSKVKLWIMTWATGILQKPSWHMLSKKILNISNISLPKLFLLNQNLLVHVFFLFFLESICFPDSLEVPQHRVIKIHLSDFILRKPGVRRSEYYT